MIRLSRFFLLAIMFFPLRAVGQKSTDSINASQIASMGTEECRALLRAALQARLEKHRNVDVTSVTLLDFYHGDAHLASKSRGRVFRLLSLGSSYRLEGQVYLKSVPQGVNDPNWSIKSNSNYDHVSGIANSVGRQKNREKIGGLIDSERDDTIDLNPMAFFFDLDLPQYMFGDERTSFVQGLIDNSAHWDFTFDSENNQVEISYTFPLWWELDNNSGELGIATFVVKLDCSTGMMPIYAQCRYGSRGRTDSWRKESHWLKNPKNVDGFWIPTEITSEILSSSGAPDRRVALTTQIIEVTQGEVKKDDLKIVFPEKTRVRDFIKGVAYTVGADGKPVGPEAPLYRAVDVESELSSTVKRPMLWLTSAIVLILAVLAVRKRLIGSASA